MNREESTTDSNGLQYIFAVWEEDEHAIFRWKFMRHRFQINSDKTVTGDFITSMWWSQEKPLTVSQEFLIVGIKGDFKYSEITALTNGAFASRNNHNLTSVEKMQGIVFKDHFILTSETIIKFTNENTLTESKHIQLNGKKSVLSILARNFGKHIYISLPSFYIN